MEGNTSLTNCKNPEEVFECTVADGSRKASCRTAALAGLSFLAGAYIALGGFFSIRAGSTFPAEIWGAAGKLAAAAVFPVGLMLVLLCGANLFTGNSMNLTAAFSRKKIGVCLLLRGGTLAWVGNFAGALFVAYAMACLSGLIFETATIQGSPKMPMAAYVVNLTNMKCHLGFMEAFWRGVGCNWLVCLSIYAAASASHVSGKILALWLPVSAFVALGMEHCIANMFFIPLGIWTGSDARYLSFEGANLPILNATWTEFFWNNLLPVTLGNIAGGALLVAGIYALIYRKKK